MITRTDLAACIDHTLLAPEATGDDVISLCAEAVALGVGAVCVSPTHVPIAVASLPTSVAVCAVIGFPSGAHRPVVKAAEAELALEDGAGELDMVVDLGVVKSHDWAAVAIDIGAVRSRTDTVLKVIVESAVLSPDELERVARVAVESGADYLKTSTGFHPRGGATTEAVATLARIAAERGTGQQRQAGGQVGGRAVGVKASGGIRDATTALAMLDAGATRLGCSATRAILDGFDELAADI